MSRPERRVSGPVRYVGGPGPHSSARLRRDVAPRPGGAPAGGVHRRAVRRSTSPRHLARRLSLGACLLAGALGGCSPDPGGSAGGNGEVGPEAEAELLHIAREVVNANFAANRVDAFAPHIADDVTAFGPYDGRLVRGGEAMLAGLRRAAEAKTTHRWEESDWHVQLYDDVGIVTFLYEHDATRPGGRRTSRNRATYVFQRREGRWTLVHDHTSAVPEGP